jgi:Icc-related predicted phosphoesterase
MKIVAISDMHGTLPQTPPCDLMLIGGDICPIRNHASAFQAEWLNTVFRRWLAEQPARKIVGVCGNHDFVFEREPGLVPRDLPWTYLQDSGIEWEGLKIWGSPWQLWFHDWAFNLYEEQIKAKWDLIPAGTDILVLHGPPFGYGDAVPGRTPDQPRLTGSTTLLKRIEEIQPKLAIFGHIHEGRGVWMHGATTLANVTILDVQYNHVYPPWVWELTRETSTAERET